MIRQNVRGWRAKLAALPSQQEKDALLRELAVQQKRYQAASDVLSAEYKAGRITLADLDRLSKDEMLKFEAWALRSGYYEDISEEQMAEEQQTALIEAVAAHPNRDIILDAVIAKKKRS